MVYIERALRCAALRYTGLHRRHECLALILPIAPIGRGTASVLRFPPHSTAAPLQLCACVHACTVAYPACSEYRASACAGKRLSPVCDGRSYRMHMCASYDDSRGRAARMAESAKAACCGRNHRSGGGCGCVGTEGIERCSPEQSSA
jgi:hypothetical protein